MRLSIVSLVLLAALCSSSGARLVQFNTSWTPECASVGCSFLSEIWDDGLIPENGDEIHVIADININLYLASSNLTDISLNTSATTLLLESSHIHFTTITLGGASSLILVNSSAVGQQTLDVTTSSSIALGEQSLLDLAVGASTFLLDSSSHINVTDTSVLISNAQSWLWGTVITTGAADIAFYREVVFAGHTSFGSSLHPYFGNVTFAANHTVFPAGFTAEYVQVSTNASVTVNVALIVECLLTLAADSALIISSADAQLLSTTAAGSVTGEGVLHLASSSSLIVPSGLHADGNWTNFNGSIVLSGFNNLTLALYMINSGFYAADGADTTLTTWGVQVFADLQFTGEIHANRFSDDIVALTVHNPIQVSRCLTSVDGSLDIQASFICGAGYPFSVSSALEDSFRPTVNFTGNYDTFGVGTLQVSSATFNNTNVIASWDYELEGLNSDLDITFTDSTLFTSGTAFIYARKLNFAGSTNVTLAESSSVDYSESAVVSGDAIVAAYGYSSLTGTDPAATFTQEPVTYLHLYENSIFQNSGSVSFEGNVAQNDASTITVNNVAFSGTTLFNSTGGLNVNGRLDLSGGAIAFPRGVEISAPLNLANGTSFEVWQSFRALSPIFVAAGARLTLKDCNALIQANDTHPAFSGNGELFFITSTVDIDAQNIGSYQYSDFQGPITIGGNSLLSPLLFSFHEVNFVDGSAGEPANVVLESYGVRFYEAVNWQGPVVLNPAVETYPSLEIYAPVVFTSVTSASASLNLTSEITSLYGPIVFQNPTNFVTSIHTSNNSRINAPRGLFLHDTQLQAGTGVTWINADVDNSDGSIIFVAADAAVQIYGNYTGTQGNILYKSLNKDNNASSSVNISNVAHLEGTTAWYGVVLENFNDTLREELKQIPIIEALSIPNNFATVVAGLPGGNNVSITSAVVANEGRERVLISNEYTAPPSSDTPIYKKWWFWFLIILAICLVLGVVAYYVRNRKRNQYTPLEM